MRQQLFSYEPVDTRPFKSFFVQMLTRDIELTDAILDLLDNCMDGVLRSIKTAKSGHRPYRGYWARIQFDARSFSIVDNCGGIPWSLHDYAFRMGRPRDAGPAVSGSVGTYGIGMKRALFKIGRHALIQTQHHRHIYEIEITDKWLESEDEWELPVTGLDPVGDEDGTMIVVDGLNPDVGALFGNRRAWCEKVLREKIESHYAMILDKGFSVTLNGDEIKPRPIRLHFSDAAKGIRPFIYEATIDAVDVFLAVGFTRPILSLAEVEREEERQQYSSEDAGWTVVCNDRVVLLSDRTELTGWGEAGVPRYHTQFTAIAGIVEFRSKHPEKLPMTTTKRGIDASSILYLQVKNKMRDGLRLFTGFTNRWKGRELAGTAKEMIRVTPALSMATIRSKAKGLPKTAVRQGRQFKPDLPRPKPPRDRVPIRYYRSQVDVTTVADHIGQVPSTPSRVGERCFELILDEAQA